MHCSNVVTVTLQIRYDANGQLEGSAVKTLWNLDGIILNTDAFATCNNLFSSTHSAGLFALQMRTQNS